MLSNFYIKTTKAFNVYCYIDNVLQDIRLDTVSIIFKESKSDSDENAVISSTANVSNNGIKGIAEFTLSPTDTDVNPRNYYYEIKWVTLGGDVYILDSDSVRILERVYD